MALREPPKYTVQQLESKATQFLQSALGGTPQIPIDIDLLLEKLPRVNLDIWPSLQDNHALLGMVAKDISDGSIWVYIDERLADTQPQRYRMTVAEELAHIIIHADLIEQVKCPEDFKELQLMPNWFVMERNAKRMAAALLMPGGCLLREAETVYQKLVQAVGYDNVPAVQRKLSALLAQSFGVSAESMRIRLTEWPMRVFDRVAGAMRDRLGYLP